MRNVVHSAVAFAGILIGATNCSAPAPSSSPAKVGLASASPAAPATPTIGRTVPIASFTGVADKKSNTLVFTRDPSSATAATSSGITPDSLNPVSAPSGVNGSPATGNVDLVTVGSCTNTYGAGNQFSCNVEVVSGITAPVANLYVQVDNETYTGCTTGCTSYDATTAANGYAAWYAQGGGTTSSELSTQNDGTLAQGHGLWFYDNASVNSAALWPVLGADDGNGFNTATQTWTFANPGNLSASYHFTVYATEYWGNYTIGNSNGNNTYGNLGPIDACTGGTSSAPSGTTAVTVGLPFDFTLWGTTSSTVYACPKVGEIQLAGSTKCVSALTSPSDLQTTPNSGITSPAFWPFWDKLTYGTALNDKSPYDATAATGRVCYRQVTSADVGGAFSVSEPNRIEVIEWRNMDFASGADTGSSLDFEAFLYEGTNEIDLYYINMVDGNVADSRAECSNCWIGTQGKDNVPNGTSYSNPLTGSGAFASGAATSDAAYTFLPQP